MVFAVIGGDLRQLKLAEALCRDGHEVRVFALGNLPADTEMMRTGSVRDAVNAADCVVLPLPPVKEGKLNAPLDARLYDTNYLLTELETARGAYIFAGGADEGFKLEAERHGIRFLDYFAREDLTIMNAAATAEGAVMTLLGRTGKTLLGARCLIVGYGRIGKLLAPRLASFGAKLTISARAPSDRAWIRAYGWEAAETSKLAPMLGSFDVIINTVPVRVIECEALPADGTYLELASAPGGASREAVLAAGMDYVAAPSLPGRIAPVSAGRYIRDTIYNILSELGVDSDDFIK